MNGCTRTVNIVPLKLGMPCIDKMKNLISKGACFLLGMNSIVKHFGF